MTKVKNELGINEDQFRDIIELKRIFVRKLEMKFKYYKGYFTGYVSQNLESREGPGVFVHENGTIMISVFIGDEPSSWTKAIEPVTDIIKVSNYDNVENYFD